MGLEGFLWPPAIPNMLTWEGHKGSRITRPPKAWTGTVISDDWDHTSGQILSRFESGEKNFDGSLIVLTIKIVQLQNPLLKFHKTMKGNFTGGDFYTLSSSTIKLLFENFEKKWHFSGKFRKKYLKSTKKYFFLLFRKKCNYKKSVMVDELNIRPTVSDWHNSYSLGPIRPNR